MNRLQILALSDMRRTLLVLVAISALGTAAASYGQSTWVPGDGWRRASADSRLQWVWGLTEGQELLLEELPTAQRSNLKNTIALQEAKAVSEIMTEYYADSANAYIPWKYMAVTARLRLAGAREDVIAERLRALRQYAADMRKTQSK